MRQLYARLTLKIAIVLAIINNGVVTSKLKSSKWAKMTKCSNDTALRDIQDLIKKGILRKEQAGGRSTNYELVILE